MSRRLAQSRSAGQAAVIAALCFVVLVGFLGLALDGANAFGQRRMLANAVDAASLAAVRALVAHRNDDGTYRTSGAAAINTAIAEFFTDRHGLDAADLDWRAFYVNRDRMDGSLGLVTSGSRPPRSADGIRIEVGYTFPTYFMGVFGRRDLTVGGDATARYGPLGTALGQDLVPLALSNTGLQILEDEGTVTVDMRGKLALDNFWDLDPSLIPPDVITEANIAHVSFANVDEPPETGDDCRSSLASNLTYWWCNGSPNKLQINRQLPTGPANYGRLNSAILWRQSNRPIAVLPVYADIGVYYQLVNFVAVEIRSYDHANGVLSLRHLPNYATSGSMVGEGSGVATGVWAVNLTR